MGNAVASEMSVMDIVEKAWRSAHAWDGKLTLISMDQNGYASARVVVAREIEPDLSFFRLNTRADTRKVNEIRAQPKVSLTFQDQVGRGGWLTIKGNARLQPLEDGTVDILVDALWL